MVVVRYYHFKPGKIYWITYIILRKFAIAFIGLMFRANPGFQLALCLLVLFTCYILQVKNRPYMSNSERDEVVREHEAKVALYHEQKKQGRAPQDIRPEFKQHYQMAAHSKISESPPSPNHTVAPVCTPHPYHCSSRLWQCVMNERTCCAYVGVIEGQPRSAVGRRRRKMILYAHSKPKQIR